MPEKIPGGDATCAGAAFSPDGRQLALIDNVPTALRVVSPTGDSPSQLLAVSGLDDSGYGGGVDWASDGKIYVTSRAGLLRVSPSDGRSETVAKPDSLTATFAGVDVLPGAEAALIVTVPQAATGAQDWRIATVDLRTGKVESFLAGTAARYVQPGYLLVAHADGAMVVVPFDLKSRRPSGPAVPLPDKTTTFPQPWQGWIDVAHDGTLLYWSARISGLGHPVLVDRQGTAQSFGAPWNAWFVMPRLSDDGTMLAVEVSDNLKSRAYVRDNRSDLTTPLTTEGFVNGRMSWKPGNPDEHVVTIISDRDGQAGVYLRHLDREKLEALPRYDPRPIYGAAWSRDGQWLLLRTDDVVAGKGDILALRPGVDSVARPIAVSPDYSEYNPVLSPDGKWLAYVSTETGRAEVVVAPFPGAQGQARISSPNGGTEPVWSHSGRELFYISAGYLMAADVAPGPEFHVLGQRRLFSIAPYVQFGPQQSNYDVTTDDQHFLMLQRNENPSSRIVAVFNWASELASIVKR